MFERFLRRIGCLVWIVLIFFFIYLFLYLIDFDIFGDGDRPDDTTKYYNNSSEPFEKDGEYSDYDHLKCLEQAQLEPRGEKRNDARVNCTKSLADQIRSRRID